MFPTVLWFGTGIAASVLATVRVQLVILSRYPQVDWMALAGGLIAGGLLLFLTLLVGFRMRSPRRAALLMVAIPVIVLTVGCLGATRFPERNFKSALVQEEWNQLHPTLRLALWISWLGERDLVLTDVSRAPGEYEEMGLPAVAAGGSRHFPDDQGYARAVDIRVSATGEMRDWLRQGSFLLMGLRASRHVGTADHLHVALP
jgi:hypothetical protein